MRKSDAEWIAGAPKATHDTCARALMIAESQNTSSRIWHGASLEKLSPASETLVC
jgi:hypothetical protein